MVLHSPTDGDLPPLVGPSAENLLGTNVAGQDVLSQLIYGTRVSLIVGLLGGLLATAIALVIGMVSGYAEGTIVDDVLSFVTNVALVIPVLPLVITLVAYSQVRGIGLIVFVIAISSLDVSIRAEVLELLNQLVQHNQVGILYITHDLLSARMLADDVVVLNHGEVVEQGPALEVIRSPRDDYTKTLLEAIPNPFEDVQR